MSTKETYIYETLYANVHNETSGHDEIYKTSKNLIKGNPDYDFVMKECAKFLGVYELHESKGFILNKLNNDEKLDFDSIYQAYSFIDGKSIIKTAKLRKSLENFQIRGRKEIVRSLVFNDLKCYNVDLIDNEYLIDNLDIDFNIVEVEDQKKVQEIIPLENEKNVINNLDEEQFSFTNFNDINIEEFLANKKQIVNFFNAFLNAKKNGKKLVVLYEKDEFLNVKLYLKNTLKLFPVSLANKIWFTTGISSDELRNPNYNIPYDICMIPSIHEYDLIHFQKNVNNVVIKVSNNSINGTFDFEKNDVVKFLINDLSSSNLKRFIEFKNDASFDDNSTFLDGIHYLELIVNSLVNIQDYFSTEKKLNLIFDSFRMICNNPLLDSNEKLDWLIYSNVFLAFRNVLLEVENNLNLKDSVIKCFNYFYLIYCKLGKKEELFTKIYDYIFVKINLLNTDYRDNDKISFYVEILSAFFKKCNWDNNVDFINDLLFNIFIKNKEVFLTFLKIYLSKKQDIIQNALALLKKLLQIRKNLPTYDPLEDLIVDLINLCDRNNYNEILQEIFNINDSDDICRIIHSIIERIDENKYLSFENVLKDRIKIYSKNNLKEYKLFLLYFIEGTIDSERLAIIVKWIFVTYLEINKIDNYDDIVHIKQKENELFSEFTKNSSFLNKFRKVICKLYFEDLIKDDSINKKIKEDDIDEKTYEEIFTYIDEIVKYSSYYNELNTAFKCKKQSYIDYLNNKNKENSLKLFRCEFVVRRLLILKNKSIVKILKKCHTPSEINDKFKEEKIKIRGNKTDNKKFNEICGNFAMQILQTDETKKANQFINLIEKTHENNIANKKIKLFDKFSGGVQMIFVTLFTLLISSAINYLLFMTIFHKRNLISLLIVSIYLILVSVIIYWSNFKERRLKNAVIRSSTYMLCIILVTYLIYIGAVLLLELF